MGQRQAGWLGGGLPGEPVIGTTGGHVDEWVCASPRLPEDLNSAPVRTRVYPASSIQSLPVDCHKLWLIPSTSWRSYIFIVHCDIFIYLY